MDFDENEIKLNLDKIKNYPVGCVSVPYFYTKNTKTALKETNIIVSNSIDYPLGILDTRSRNCSIVNSIENGAQKIELVFPNVFLSNKKYDKIRNDIKTNKQICDDHNVPLFIYLEYRVFTHQSLIKACDILKEFDINYAYASTGHMIDNIDDNIIATMLLSQKSNITTIFTGNIWTKEHSKKIDKHNISYIRTSSLESVKNLIG
jgi:deoxyribose-phosphate aldolase